MADPQTVDVPDRESLRDQTIPAVVHRAAQRFGTIEAVVDGGARPSFIDMEESIDGAARALMAWGVEPGDRVAVWAPNSLAWIVISFAVYSVGAVLVPINTRFKGAEAAYVLRTAEARLLFTVTDFLDTDYVRLLAAEPQSPDLAGIVVVSGSAPPGTLPWDAFLLSGRDVDAGAVQSREAALTPLDASDIIFTSGTTGRPKGAVLSHGASVWTYVQWAERVGVARGDRTLVVYPFFHTAGLKSGVLASFIMGATIVPHAVFDATSVMARVAEEQLTVLPGPPSVFQSILAHPDLARFDLSSLRLSVTGAAMVPVELIDRMGTELGLDSVVTAYGLTETHGTATSCDGSDSSEIIATTVGRPLDGLELRIVDDEERDVPTGDRGEVLIRGFNVTTGYFNDPEATASALDEDGWLRTGDVGYLGDDGYLRLVDRKKDIIIVGGFNASPAEIEGVILGRPDIAQAAVVAAPDQRLGEVGAVFVVARSGSEVDPDELISWCRQRMANYKAPRYAYVVDTLPMNASGKVQKFVLRDQVRGWLDT